MTALIIDEPRLYAMAGPVVQDWWTGFRLIALAGRVHDRSTSADGCVREVRCADERDAHALLRVMMASGFPRSAVRVAR